MLMKEDRNGGVCAFLVPTLYVPSVTPCLGLTPEILCD